MVALFSMTVIKGAFILVSIFMAGLNLKLSVCTKLVEWKVNF